MAPWLIKNVIDTGDPVYPLGYRVFHGRYWDDAMQAKWQHVHGPQCRSRGRSWPIPSSTWRVGRTGSRRSIVALAPLAWLRPGTRRLAWTCGLYVWYLFFTWWLLTHRLDRFWLPLLPAARCWPAWAPIGSGGTAWSTCPGGNHRGRAVTNLPTIQRTGRIERVDGRPGFLRRDLPERLTGRWPRSMRSCPKTPDPAGRPGGRLSRRPSDRVQHRVQSGDDRDAGEGPGFRRVPHGLRERRLTHVYVDWKEIQRHREPGGYGFTDFVTPERFARWVADGVLERPRLVGQEQELYRIL